MVTLLLKILLWLTNKVTVTFSRGSSFPAVYFREGMHKEEIDEYDGLYM